MSQGARAKLFMSGNSQALRIPKELRLPGREVRITRHGDGLLIEPIGAEPWANLLAVAGSMSDDYFEQGREQPPMPEDRPAFTD